MKNFSALALAALFLCSVSSSLNALPPMKKDRIENVKEWPGLGRYPDTFLLDYKRYEFDAYRYPKSFNNEQEPNAFDYLDLEGRRSLYVYKTQKIYGPESLKAFRSLISKLERLGFKADITCSSSKELCGHWFAHRIYYTKAMRNNYMRHFPVLGSNPKDKHFHYYSGTKEVNGTKTYVTMMVSGLVPTDPVRYTLDFLEPESLKLEELELSEESIISGLSDTGRAVLSGLYFDTGSSTLLNTSKDSLAVIAKFLESSKKRYLIVGHTDTKGSYQSNIDLSYQRANAVLNALKAEYGVNSDMLKATGVGFASPAKSNLSDKGREKNRRVELVEVEQF